MKADKKERYDYSRWYVDIFADELPRQDKATIFLGLLAETNYKHYLNIDEFTKHTIITGATGNGKTITSQILADEALVKIEKDIKSKINIVNIDRRTC